MIKLCLPLQDQMTQIRLGAELILIGHFFSSEAAQ